MKTHLLLLLVTALAACTTVPGSSSTTPPMQIDASDGGDLATEVCDHLVAVGCAQPPACVPTWRRMQGHVTDFHPACLLAATDRASVLACGSVTCP